MSLTPKESNVILGIGTDIIEIYRIRKAIQRHGMRFLNRVFTRNEIHYCQCHRDPMPRFAGRFAAKEAIAKALGTGIGATVNWLDMEILNSTSGKPEVFLTKKIEGTILFSISHCNEYATATAIYTQMV